MRKFKDVTRKIYKTLYKISSPKIRKMLLRIIFTCEGGEYWSMTARDIFKEIHGIEIGEGSYGCFDPSRFPPGTVIGNYCSIAQGVRYLNANHPMSYASMHPMFYNPKLGFVKEEKIKRSSLHVGHDVWIGCNTLILSGCVEIGNGAVIGAGSVVTKNIEPYSIVVGIPAKKIKSRFNENITSLVEHSEWFLLSHIMLSGILDSVIDPVVFSNKAKVLRYSEIERDSEQ